MIQILKHLKEYLIIKKSGLFDAQYYSSNYKENFKSFTDPLMHFINYGWKEQKNPSEYFDTSFYLSQNPDILNNEINPLVHYILNGYYEGRNPSLYFSIKNYPNNETSISYPEKPNLLNFLCNNEFRNISYQIGLIEKHNQTNNHKRSPVFTVNERALTKYKLELKNWNGQVVKVVQWNRKLWIIKDKIHFSNFQRELLVSLLAKGLVNAAEIKTLDYDEIEELTSSNLLDDDATPFNTILVRLAQDYNLAELPLQSLDQAMAGEFVFSLWVRRRDPGRWNRAYTDDGLPVFYDYHASLNFEPWLFDIDTFFERTDPGHAGSWRVMELKDTELSTTISRKQREGINFINNVKYFNQALDEMTSKILHRDMNLRNLIIKAGYSGQDIEIFQYFLEKTTESLQCDVEKMKKVLFALL